MPKLSFAKYLAEWKRKNGNYHDDREFLNRNGYQTSGGRSYTAKINATKKKYAAWLSDVPDALDKPLSDLDKIAAERGIDVSARLPNVKQYSEKEWQQHERHVAEGINKLFQTGVFAVKTEAGEREVRDAKNETFAAKQAGGAVESDIKVENLKNGRSFFVECKLNYDTAGYFKYGLTIRGGRIEYDHGKYLQGKSEDEKKQITQLFTDSVNLTEYLTKLVHSSDVKKHWEAFQKRALDVQDFICGNDEFREFASKVKFTQTWPDDFQKFAEVFDVYCRFYIEKYDTLMAKLFKTFDSSSLDVRDFMVSDAGRAAAKKAGGDWKSKNAAFKPLAQLKQAIADLELDVDEAKFDKLCSEILLIEGKFTALLRGTKYGGDISAVQKLKASEKTRCFYQMFQSVVGRKKRGSAAYDLAPGDELGNMVVCPPFPHVDSEMARLITNFYVKKDHCAYIQIGPAVYQFDRNFNPLNLPGLPIFSESLKYFDIWLSMSDDLRRINLHVRAIDPATRGAAPSEVYSFRERDPDFVQKKVQHIDIDLSRKI